MFAKIKSLFTRKRIAPADTTPAFNEIPGMTPFDFGVRYAGLTNTPAPATRYGFAPTYVKRYN